MYLNIILTIFVILQIVTIILIYKWWNKYGRNFFKSFTDMKNNLPLPNFNSPSNNPWNQLPDIGKMMKELNQMMGKK